MNSDRSHMRNSYLNINKTTPIRASYLVHSEAKEKGEKDRQRQQRTELQDFLKKQIKEKERRKKQDWQMSVDLKHHLEDLDETSKRFEVAKREAR